MDDVAVQINRGSNVLDNLIRPMICRHFAVSSAKIVVEVKEDIVIEAMDGLSLVSSQQILATETIDDNNADSIACFENAGRNGGLVAVLNIENETVTSASISNNEAVVSLNRCTQKGYGSVEAS